MAQDAKQSVETQTCDLFDCCAHLWGRMKPTAFMGKLVNGPFMC